MALPSEVSSAVAGMGADAGAVAVVVLVAVIGIRAVKFLKRAFIVGGVGGGGGDGSAESFVFRTNMGNRAGNTWATKYGSEERW